MATITFNGDTIWTSADGSYEFHPGMITRRWIDVPMLRTNGEIAKAGGLSGCDHNLTLRFHDVEVGDIAGVFSTMNALSRSLSEGTLVVPDYGSYRNCTCRGVTPSKQTAGIKDIDPGLDLTKAYTMEFSVRFRQSRP